MKDGLIISALSMVPKKPVARFMGWSARLSLPRFIHRLLIRYFVWKYDVNLEECQGGIDDFDSLSEFFIRRLKEGRREIDRSEDIVVSPVDGRVHAFGRIENGKFFQSAEQNGSVEELLGEATEDFDPKRYQNGSFAIIYLSPQDYHRVHLHLEGDLLAVRYMPGKLWPVFPAATRKIPHLFDRNERMVFSFLHGERRSISAMIGAFGVGRMRTDLFDVTTKIKNTVEERKFNKPLSLERAGEIGRFELGSTVVLFFNSSGVFWNIEKGDKVVLGQKIAMFGEDSIPN